jgi:hypothetical protein
MPIFNIEVTDKTAQKLQQVVDELNQQTGDSLTIESWITGMVKDTAIGQELGDSIPDIQKTIDDQNRENLSSAVEVKRQELLSDLDK